MKKLFIILSLLFVSLVSAQDYYEYEVSPSLVTHGDSIQITFSAESDIDFHNGFPKLGSLEYRGASRNMQIINGASKRSISLNFVATRAGDITIPELEVTLDGKVFKCKKRTIKIWKDASLNSKSETIYARILYNGKEELPEKIYTGQSFVVDYEVSVAPPWRYLDRNTFYDYRPEISAGDLNLIAQGQDLNRYIYFKEIDGSRIIDGSPYRTRTYRYIMSPVKSGEYEFKIEQQILAVKRRPGLPRNDTKKKNFSKTQQIVVTPVPSPPAHLKFLDLTGDWKVSAKTSKSTVKTGHTFELVLNVTGSGGDLSRLSAPKLAIPGFEIEPRPDINFDKKPATIKYAMRALTPDAKLPELTFGTFNHQTEKFIEHKVTPSINITGNAIANTQAQEPTKATQVPRNTVTIKGNQAPELLSQLPLVKRPLLVNISPIWYFAALLFPLLFITLTLWKNKEAKTGVSSAKQKQQLNKKIKALCEEIKSTNNQAKVNAELIPLLAAYYDLPQGTTADELVQHIEDKELGKMLQQVSHAEFLPESVIHSNLQSLTSKLTQVLALLACLFIIPNSSAESGSTEYRQANYEAAIEQFTKDLSVNADDATTHANLAHSYYMTQDYILALAHYETASRLAPSNAKIRNQLNNTLKKLKISRETSIFEIANRLRPDQWLKAAISIWVLFWLIICIQRLKKVPGKRWTALWGCALTATCLLAFFTQINSRYKSDQAIIKSDAAAFVSIEKKMATDKILPKGEIVPVKTTQDGFSFVIYRNQTFWINSENLHNIW
ncbi:MAG: BatD family protein [Lentisphaeraceae bacterium]|nr:BatD family protein [Lentisphaeraceae bacterium]